MPFSVQTISTGSTTPEFKSGITYTIGVLPADTKRTVNNLSGTTTYLCTVDYEDQEEWLYEMLGYSWTTRTPTSSSTISNMYRVLPEKNPEGMYALDAQLVRNIGHIDNDANGWPIYDKAVWQVTFGHPLYDVLEDEEIAYEFNRFVVWKRKSVAQNEKIPGGGFYFQDTPPTAVPDMSVVKVGRYVELQAKWIDVPYVNTTALDLLCNKVNQYELNWNDERYPIETVMLTGYDEEILVNAFKTKTRNLTLNFGIRTDGRTWNKLWRRNAAGAVTYDKPLDLASQPIFALADLNAVFTA